MDRSSNFRAKYFKPNFLCQYASTFTGTLLIVCTGMYYGWPSPSLPILLKGNSEMHITNSEGSWIAAAPSIGVPFGCIISGLLVNRIGRKTCMLIASPILCLIWFAVAYSTSAIILICSRFVAGVADGLVHTVLPMYVCEIADKNIRGLLGSSIQVAFMFGVLTINIIGQYCNIKTTALIASTVPLVHFAGCIFIPESPYFLILKQNYEKAASNLRKLNRSKNIDKEISELKSDIEMDSHNTERFIDVLKRKSNRKALGIVLGLKVVEQFTGFHAISFYCLTIFTESEGAIKGSTATIIYFCVQMIVCTLSSILVDITGRRPLLIISVAGSGCGLVAEGLYFYLKNESDMDMSKLGLLPLGALLLYTITFNIGLTTIPVLMMGELFPTSGKALLLCITGISYGILLSFVSKFFQIVKDNFGTHVPFFVFALCCVLGLLFIIYCVPETKGKTLEQVQMELKGLSSKENARITPEHSDTESI